MTSLHSDRIRKIGSVVFCTDSVVERLRTRASRIDGDGLAYVSKDELRATADRLEQLAGYAREYHDRLLSDREDLKLAVVEDPSLTGVPTV